MSAIALLLIFILCACLAVVAWLIVKSPEGHEDRRGFHHGSPEEPAGSREAEGKKTAESGGEPRIVPRVPAAK